MLKKGGLGLHKRADAGPREADYGGGETTLP